MIEMEDFEGILERWQAELRACASEEKSRDLARFFKTGEGEYGEGDVFAGIVVPDCRRVSVRYANVPLPVIEEMLRHEVHEFRLAGFLALVKRYGSARERVDRIDIARFYAEHACCANNWDLVDLSAPYILGAELVEGRGLDVVDWLTANPSIWHQRIAMVSTLALIRRGRVDLALRLAVPLVGHSHMLLQKASGWMLREVGKRDMEALRGFLRRNIGSMSATALSYATEKMLKPEREYWRSLRKRDKV